MTQSKKHCPPKYFLWILSFFFVLKKHKKLTFFSDRWSVDRWLQNWKPLPNTKNKAKKKKQCNFLFIAKLNKTCLFCWLKGDAWNAPLCPIYFQRGGIPSVFQVQFQYLLWNYLYIQSIVSKNFMHDCAHKRHKPHPFQKFCYFSWKIDFFWIFCSFKRSFVEIITMIYELRYM